MLLRILIIPVCVVWLTAVQANPTFRLYVSASMEQPLLNVLLTSTNGETVVVRGVSTCAKSLMSAIQRWYHRLNTNFSDIAIEINPVAFQENRIDRVPALSLEVNGKTELIAFGVTSTDWLLAQYQSGKRGNIGTYGTTYPISEPDLLDVLLQRLQQQNWQGIQEKAQQRFQQKVLSYGVSLPTSRQAIQKTVSLKGQWHRPMIALDINDRHQQQAVIPWLEQYPDALVMVTNWSFDFIRHLPSIWHRHVIYLLSTELVQRFQIDALPVLLAPENRDQWQIKTAKVSSFSELDILVLARTMVDKAIQPTVATLLAADRPASALCQSVPILSEKLITSIPWKELFPIRIGLATMGAGNVPGDRVKSTSGLCTCEDNNGVLQPGITTGFWRPQRLIELTRSPGCLMAMGGHRLPMVDQRRWGTLGSANIPKGLTYMHAHVYSLPLLEMLNLFTGMGNCNSDLLDFDLINLSEVDPSWNHPELAALLTPDIATYSNPAAINACTEDGLSALNGHPIDSLHWCAGSWGNLYPLSGFTSTYGHFADNTSLLATRALAKLHRIGLGKKTIGQEALCQSRITPWLPKSQYKMSMFWPEPEKHKAHWIGQSAATWGMHRHPLGKDDAMYVVWQYRDCCQAFTH